MKITVFEKTKHRGSPLKPIFNIDDVFYWRYEPVNDTVKFVIGGKYSEIGTLILNVENIEFCVDE